MFRVIRSCGLLVVVAAVIVGCGSGLPSSGSSGHESSPKRPGSFQPTGSMAAGRSGQSATLLSDGRVLVVGGTLGSGPVLNSAELYDPKSGTFSATGSTVDLMRDIQTARLADGRVLVVDGNSLDAKVSAEIYDPAGGTFAKTGSLANRDEATLTLLQDGRVLVAGGSGTDDNIGGFLSAELFDPATGQFEANRLNVNRSVWTYGHAASGRASAHCWRSEFPGHNPGRDIRPEDWNLQPYRNAE